MLAYLQSVTSQAGLIAGAAEPFPANATMNAQVVARAIPLLRTFLKVCDEENWARFVRRGVPRDLVPSWARPFSARCRPLATSHTHHIGLWRQHHGRASCP